MTELLPKPEQPPRNRASIGDALIYIAGGVGKLLLIATVTGALFLLAAWWNQEKSYQAKYRATEAALHTEQEQAAACRTAASMLEQLARERLSAEEWKAFTERTGLCWLEAPLAPSGADQSPQQHGPWEKYRAK